MITLDKLLQHCETLQLPAAGREYLKRVASSPPSRRVRSLGTNVVSRFPSRKMGVVIQAESHRHELALVYVLEHDPDVLAYWDQPEGIKITYLSANGHSTSPVTTPDYLVLRKSGIEWIEVKPHDALPELAKEMPNRFVLGDDGKWRCPPAENVAKAYGYTYRIWTPKEVDPTWLRNIQNLSEYFGADLNLVPAAIRTQLAELVKTEPGISMAALRRQCAEASADHINNLVVHDQLYVDLAHAPLTDPGRVRVYASRAAAEAYALLSGGRPDVGGASEPETRFSPGAVAIWDDRHYTVGNWAADKVTLLTSGSPEVLNRDVFLQCVRDGVIKEQGEQAQPALTGKGAEILRQASPEDLEIATHRYHVLIDITSPGATPVPQRTLRRWRRMHRLAEEQYGHGLLGLVPRFRDRGNRHQRFPEGLLAVVDKVIDEVYCTPTRPNKHHAYQRLRLECESRGFFSPSYPWFTKHISTRSKYTLILARQGKRAAHRYELIHPGAPNDNHGDYPWDICLTDHTLIDCELVCAETGENLGRAWLSILVDGFSRRILAFCLTFDPPSYRTLMILVRRCVERHKRLPRCLVVDGGKEFQSAYFETLTAAYSVLLKRRPPGKARFGTIVERLFGTVNSTFLHALQGNTQNTRAVRQLTKSMNPKGHAVYTLEDLDELMSRYAFDIYDRRPHPTLNCPPAEKYARGLEISGARTHRAIADDESFHLMTLPTTPKGTAKIQPGMGVKIFGFYYWAEEMRSRQLEGKSIRVGYDPENLGIAWAYLGDRWVLCRPSVAFGLEGRTEKELQIAALELRRSRQLLGHRQSISNRALAEFLKSAQASKALCLQQAKDRAQRRIRLTSNDSGQASSQELPPSADASQLPQPPIEPLEQQHPPTDRPEDYGDF